MNDLARGRASPSLEDVRAFWDANPLFGGESRYVPGDGPFFEEFEDTTLREHSGAIAPIFVRGVRAGVKVLDVGCGVGFWVGQFCRLGAQVSACDLSERAVEITRRRLQFYSLSGDVRAGNAEQLPYADASFEHINCQGVIHHTPNPKACIDEFYRVLAAGGTVCLSVYFKTWALRSKLLFKAYTFLARRMMVLKGRGRESMLWVDRPEELVRMYDGALNPIGRAYTHTELQELLGGRFQVLERMRFGFPRRALPFEVPDRLHRLLSRRFGLMIIYRCKKLGTNAGIEAS